MKLTLYTADCVGDAKNCVYPNRAEILNKEELAKAAAHDQVFAKYKNSYRNISNFLESDVIPMDCDNDHSDDPADWLSASALEDIFSDVDHIIIPSRHHMLPKKGKAARPRFHILFAIPACTDAAMYAAVKTAVQKKYGVELVQTKEQIAAFPNADITLSIYSENDIETYRDVLYYIAQVLGCFCCINRLGELELRKYTVLPVQQIGSRHRFSSTFSDFITRYTAVSSTNLRTLLYSFN